MKEEEKLKGKKDLPFWSDLREELRPLPEGGLVMLRGKNSTHPEWVGFTIQVKVERGLENLFKKLSKETKVELGFKCTSQAKKGLYTLPVWNLLATEEGAFLLDYLPPFEPTLGRQLFSKLLSPLFCNDGNVEMVNTVPLFAVGASQGDGVLIPFAGVLAKHHARVLQEALVAPIRRIYKKYLATGDFSLQIGRAA